MKTLFTEIEIAASPETVWRVLTDFDQFPSWNPFIKRATGTVQEGNQLEVSIEPPNGSAMTFKPQVKCVAENKELRWLGHFLMPGLFDGEHSFELSPNSNGTTRFIQRETFKGLLVPFFAKSLEGATKQGFNDMNDALKQRVEAIAA